MPVSFLKRVARAGLTWRALRARTAFLRQTGIIPKPRTTQPSSIQSILFSFPYHSVGDVILSLTLLERLHALWPNAAIDVAVGSTMAPLIGSLPFVRKVFSIPRPRTRHPLLAAYADIHNETRIFRRQIASIAYDMAIAPRWDAADSFLSAYLAYLTGAPLRCGYAGDGDALSSNIGQLYTHIATGGAHEHESKRYTGLLARCGFERGSDGNSDIALQPLRSLINLAASRRLQRIALQPPTLFPYVVLAPSATSPRRMWPLERFAELARNLFQQHGIIAVVLGANADRAHCNDLCRMIGPEAISLAGQTDALQMLDLVSAAALFVGNDSGPGHLAGALGIETFIVSPFPLSSALFHVNSPRRFHPVGPRVHVLQPLSSLSPCTPFCVQHDAHCILQITVQEVLAAIDQTFLSSSVESGGCHART